MINFVFRICCYCHYYAFKIGSGVISSFHPLSSVCFLKVVTQKYIFETTVKLFRFKLCKDGDESYLDGSHHCHLATVLYIVSIIEITFIFKYKSCIIYLIFVFTIYGKIIIHIFFINYCPFESY